jgi:hypothetical protein
MMQLRTWALIISATRLPGASAIAARDKNLKGEQAVKQPCLAKSAHHRADRADGVGDGVRGR